MHHFNNAKIYAFIDTNMHACVCEKDRDVCTHKYILIHMCVWLAVRVRVYIHISGSF